MSNTFKKFMAALTSLFMALALVPATALAADATEGTDGNFTYSAGTGAGSIEITLPTSDQSNSYNYKVYKVFSATGNGSAISYKLVDGKTAAPTGFTVDNAGNVTYAGGSDVTQLTAADIQALATYVANDTAVADVDLTTTNANGNKTLTISGLDYGYYYVTTATGSAVSVTSTNPKGETRDKNTVTQVDDKKATQVSEGGSTTTDGHTAVAELGSTVSFEATVTFGAGAKNVKFHDTMSSGLTLNANSITVTGLPQGATYTVQETPDQGDTFTISFSDGIAQGTTATITYTATVTSGELTTDPATNKAHTTYGDKNNSTSDKEVDVYNATVTVAKTFTGGTVNEGDSAQFVLKNSDNKYYKVEGNDVSWVDTVDAATKLTFTEAGSQTFTGLDNGEYTLIESKTPAGFKTAANQTITINGADTTTAANRAQTENITNEAGSSLPSTGGAGTVAFTVVGAALIVTAGVLLVTRRRMQQ